MKKIILLFIILISVNLYAQKVDTIIKTPIYTSYFSYQVKEPLFVSYRLYKGGGTSSRVGMVFKTNGLFQSATEADYSHKGYDIGHMANAEDFAFDPNKEIITFRFYNALPQTPKLNRGIWKVLETNIRKQSQTDSLLIICGGYSFNTKIGSIFAPSFCFKIVKNLKTKEINCYLFPNDNSDSEMVIPCLKLIQEIPYNDVKVLITNLLN